MPALFRLHVYTAERPLVDAEVEEVTAQGALGEIGVLADHATMVTALEPGTLSYQESGRVVRLTLGAGFAEVRDNVMTVLADSGAIANP